MTLDRWRQVTAVFHAAVARDAAARARDLDDACVNDSALPAKVDAMLAAHRAWAPCGRSEAAAVAE